MGRRQFTKPIRLQASTKEYPPKVIEKPVPSPPRVSGRDPVVPCPKQPRPAMTVVLKPQKNTQREAEATLEMAKAVVHARGDEFGILRLDHVTIASNYTADTNTLTVYNGDKIAMQAIWTEGSGERPFFVVYTFGPWRWILRRAHAARLAEARPH